MDNIIGNGSTILKWICMYIAGWFIGLCVANGLNFPVDAATLSEVLFGIVVLGIGYIDAKYPNTMKWLGNAIRPNVDLDNPVLNDEYECDDGDGC